MVPAAATEIAISCIPIFRPSLCAICRFKSRKVVSFRKFPKAKRVLLSDFISGMTEFGKIDRPSSKNTTDTSRSLAFTRTDGDEDDRSSETQTFSISRAPVIGRDMELDGLQTIINKSSKWLVSAILGAIIIWKHDAEAMWVAMGAVSNSALSMTLKRLLNQKRPVPTMRSDPGMPSSHAQSIFYAVVFIVFSLMEWLGVDAFTLIAGAFIMICGSYLSWLRVSQQLHTVNQVVVGSLIGSIFSIMWLWSWDAFVSTAFSSSSLVRVAITLCSASFCVAFTFYVIKNWLMEEE